MHKKVLSLGIILLLTMALPLTLFVLDCIEETDNKQAENLYF